MKKYVWAFLLCCGIIACNIGELDFENLRVQPISGDFVLPLGFTSYTIRDLIDEQNDSLPSLTEDTTSLLRLYYTELINYSANNDFVDIQDIVGSDNLDLSSVGTVPGAATIPFTQDVTESYTYAGGDEELDSVYYSQGQLVLTVNSDAAADVNYTITFLNTINQNSGQPVVFTGTVANGQGSDSPAPQDLAGYYTRLVGSQNEFSLRFEANIDVAAGDTFLGDENISYEFTYQNQAFDLIYGKLGEDTINVGNEAIDIDFFEDSGDDGFFLGNPVFRFTFDNSFGVPVATDFSGIYSEDEDGSQNFLDGNIVRSNNLPVIEAAGNPGETQQTVIEINRGNSNISQLLSNTPSRLAFDVTAISNYYDNTVSNFVQPDNELSGFIEVEIPLEVSLKNYEQSFAFNLSGGLETKDIDSAFLRIVTINELPFSGKLSMEIQDSTRTAIFTIPEVLVFAAPFIDINGFVTDPSGASADIPLSAEAIEALAEGDRIEMKVVLNTPVSQTSREIFVKILADYTLDIKVGLGARYNYEF